MVGQDATLRQPLTTFFLQESPRGPTGPDHPPAPRPRARRVGRPRAPRLARRRPGPGVAGLRGGRAGRSRFGPPADRRHALEVLLTALLVVGSVPLIFFFLLTTVQLHPTTCDALAYAADGTLGTQVTFVLGRCFAAAPALALLSGTV